MLRPARAHCRPGFTLVETLVAVGIMILLAGILVVALNQSGIKAKETATLALIRKVSAQVQERLEALDRLKSQPQWTVDAKAAMNNPSAPAIPDFRGIPQDRLDIAKTLLVKYRVRQSFPQSFLEFQTYDPAEYAKFTANYNSSNHVAETESSALLYYVLTNGKALGIPTLSPGDFKDNEARDTDGDKLLEFIDAWGRPLRFYRWPTRLIRPGEDFNGNGMLDAGEDRNGNSMLDGPGVTSPIIRDWTLPLISGLPAAANPDPLGKDQDDPTLVLYDSNPNSTISRLFTEANYHTPQTYHDFLIVSSGPDGQKIATPNDAFGLYPPQDTSSTAGYLCQPFLGKFDAVTDNITNRNR